MNAKIQPRRQLIRKLVIATTALCGGIFLCYQLYSMSIALAEFPLAFLNFASMHSPKCHPTNIAGIESVTGFKFPPSARVLSSDCGGLAAWWAEVQFDMDPSEVNAFVSSTNVKLPLSATVKPSVLGCCDQLADEAKTYLYGFYMSGEWFEDIFIDTSNPAQFRVYFTLLAG